MLGVDCPNYSCACVEGCLGDVVEDAAFAEAPHGLVHALLQAPLASVPHCRLYPLAAAGATGGAELVLVVHGAHSFGTPAEKAPMGNLRKLQDGFVKLILHAN